MVLVCLFHGAGTGVGTLCHFSTVSFRLSDFSVSDFSRKNNIVHPDGLR
jgi:hypothetical protein